MKSSFSNFVVFISLCLGICAVKAQTIQTNVAVVVRHAPSLNGGTIQGSLQQLNGESVTINSGFVMTGDLLVPGTPTLVLNGHPPMSASFRATEHDTNLLMPEKK